MKSKRKESIDVHKSVADESTKREEAICSIAEDIIDDIILGLCFQLHRSIKLGTYTLDQVDEETEKVYAVVEAEGLDVFGQVAQKKPLDCICPNCFRNMSASRFAPHLEKCMGMGRNSSRIASRRLANSGKMMEDDDDDIFGDDDWTVSSDKKGKRTKKERGNSNSPRRPKAPKRNGENGTPRPGTPSSVNSGEHPVSSRIIGLTVGAFGELAIEEKRTVLSQSCGVISEHTGKLCTRSHRCPQHTDEQRRAVRTQLIGHQEAADLLSARGKLEGVSLEQDEVHIDVDSYDDADGQALRDTLSRLTWEEDSNFSPAETESPAYNSNGGVTNKRRKKKPKHRKKKY